MCVSNDASWVLARPLLSREPSPVPFQAHYRDHGRMLFARSLLVLHNMAHQGRGSMEDLRLLEVPDKYTELFK